MTSGAYWFQRGIEDAERGWISGRPKLASLQVRSLPRKKIAITGKIRRYRKHFERLGGKFDEASDAWVFPAAALELLQNDRELNAVGNLWHGCAEDTLEQARAAYREGYALAQQRSGRGPTAQRSNRRR